VGTSPAAGEITTLLDRWAQGDAQAFQALTPYVYQDLRNLARGFLRRERSEHTLQATGLVNQISNLHHLGHAESIQACVKHLQVALVVHTGQDAVRKE